MGLTGLTGCGGGFRPLGPETNLPVPSTVNNTVPVTAGLTSSGGRINGVFVSVTVCGPAVLPVGQNPPGGPPPPPTCQTIPNILIDTGSVGLRLIETGTVDGLSLPVVTDSNGNTMQECVQFADFSYAWGPVARATIQIAGETAAQVPLEFETPNTGIPIQIITQPDFVTTPAPADCLASPPSGGVPIAVNTVQTLGANGILGVGSFLQDCGSACASSPPRNQYFSCPSGLCSVASVPQNLQIWNPVAAFAYDNNGLVLSLPYAPPGGSGPVTGSLIFGNGTQSNNTFGNVTLFAIDSYGNFPQVTLVTQPSPFLPAMPVVNYLSPQNGSYLDSASPAIYFSDAQSLAVPECLNSDGQPLGLYCPSTLTPFFAQVYGTNKASETLSWYVENATGLLSSQNSVFSTLGGDSGINVSTDYADFGLPFFLSHTVYVGFAGSGIVPPLGIYPVTYANGYWAF
jgi:hypothetical protein